MHQPRFAHSLFVFAFALSGACNKVKLNPLPDSGARFDSEANGDASGDAGSNVVVSDALQIYPQAPNAVQSSTFQVRVNGSPVFVEENRRISHSHFAFAGTVQIEVEFVDPIRSFRLSPLHGIEPEVDGNVLSFSLSVPRKLILHQVNGGAADFALDRRLFIFADPLAAPPPDPSLPDVQSAVGMGINPTSGDDQTGAIQALIDGLSSSGGGTLVFDPGLYVVRSLFMKDDVTLHIAPGARIQGSDVPPGEDGLIKFFRVNNAHLKGRGSANANGVFLRYQRGSNSSIIRADESSNCTMEDVILLDPSSFAVWVRKSEHWTMYNTKQIDYANTDLENTGGEDGIDPDASRHFLADNIFIYAGDDATAIKAIDPPFEFVEDITFRNSVIFNAALGSGLGIGSQLGNSHLRDITFENNDVVAARFSLDAGMREFTSSADDTPILERVWFRNNRFGFARGSYVFGATVARRGIFRDFVLENLDFAGHQDGPTANFPQLQTLGDESVITRWTLDGVRIAVTLLRDLDQFSDVGPRVSEITFANSTPKVVGVSLLTGDDAEEDAYFVAEGAEARFRVQRTGDTSAPVDVTYQMHGMGDNGEDYQTLSGTVTIDAGRDSADIALQTIADGVEEGLETVLISLTNTHGGPYMIGPDYHAMVTIADGM